ncbi:MAG TPA: hypothetical protein VFI30_00280 [Nocardioidaceae bacterium]|nr:hypothetical protein [Nocardioidaceae bacterium]
MRPSLRRRAAMVAAVAAVALSSTGCMHGAGPHAAPTSATTPASTAPSTTSQSSDPTTTDPTADKEIVAANKALTGSLFRLVAAAKKLQTDDDLPGARRAMSVAVRNARSALAAERHAAYKAPVRVCSDVWADHDKVVKAVGAATVAHKHLKTRVSVLDHDLRIVGQRASHVRSDAKALETARRGVAGAPQSVASGQVRSALKSLATQESDLRSVISATVAKAAKLSQSATKMSANSLQIAAKAC